MTTGNFGLNNLTVVSLATAGAFISLKATGLIAWPWVWVLAPLWGFMIVLPLLLVLGLLILVLGAVSIALENK
jgi:hypothetical protein